MPAFAQRSARHAGAPPARVPVRPARIGAVREILHGPRIQPKLKVGAVNDPAEAEADRVADQVMRMPDEAVSTMSGASAGLLQRKCAECEREIQRKAVGEATLQRDIGDDEIQEQLVQAYLGNTDTVQRQVDEPEDDDEAASGPTLIQAKHAGSEAAAPSRGLESRVHSLESGGQPLPDSVRRFMEPRFGHDFSDVRVHADAEAAETARLANARAFTFGRNVVFGAGQYAPDVSADGGSLIAHELTHVMQQGHAGPRLQRKIQIGGKDFTPTEDILTTVSEVSPAMKEFVVTMHNGGSPPVYSFSSNQQFIDEIFVRAKAIKGMERVHEGCCGYYSDKEPPYLDATYWDQIGTDVNFKMKSPLPTGKQPADAIEAIFATGAKTRVECLSMMVAIEYYSMLKGLGADKFNKLFAGGITISASATVQPLVFGAVPKYEIKNLSSKNLILPGDWVYFKNFKDYTTRVPGGYWQGENAVCTGIGYYRGFGVASLSESKMNEELVKRYNEDGKPKLSKTEADLLADGGGLQLTTVVRPIMSQISP